MKYISLIIYCFVSVIAAYTAVSVLIPYEDLLPTHTFTDGQVIYAEGKGVPIETGYRIQLHQVAVPTPVVITEKEKEKPKRVVKTRPSAREEKKETTVKPKETTPPEKLNPYIMERIIRTAGDTRYFSNKSQTIDGVTLEILSLTPRARRQDYIIKFKLTNDTKRHFIPQVVSVQHGDNFVNIQTFIDFIIDAEKSTFGYIWVREPRGTDAGSLRLNESGGGYRKFNISY